MLLDEGGYMQRDRFFFVNWSEDLSVLEMDMVLIFFLLVYEVRARAVKLFFLEFLKGVPISCG